MAEVKLVNISKIYGNDNVVVKNINIDINDREFVVLVGPSGCGKTTTLRMVAGLEEISEGDLYIDGKRVNDVSPKDRDIAMVFQNYALYPHMTVFENMAFGLKLRKFDKKEIEERVNEAANILNLTQYLKRKPKELSGGQRQRVAVGRAIVRHPKVFLFDEPLSNLDAKLRVQMRTEISKLHQKLGATMIYVTHDQTEAMTMGDKIVIMKDGEVQQIDSPLNLYNKPINKFVGGFIGSPSMNFIEGEIKYDGSLKFISKRNSLTIPLLNGFEKSLKGFVDKKVMLGIRPEDIYDLKNGNQIVNSVRVEAELEVVEPMGNEIFLYFQLDGEQITARVSAREKPRAGENISLLFDTAKIHFFELENERRIAVDVS